MKITFKKALASIAMLSMLTGFALNVNAAGQASTSSYTGNTITVTVPGVADFTADLVTAITILDQDGWAPTGVDIADVSEVANTTFTIDTTDNGGTLANGIYSVSFVTADGNFGSSVFVVGATNEIQVTANVLPILSMKVTGAIVAFGDLVADTATTAANTTIITVNTNAASGYQMSVANAATGLYNGTVSIDNAAANENLSTGYGYGINAATDDGVNIDSINSAASANITAFAGTDSTNVSGMSNGGAVLASAAGPVATQITTVSYHTRISALQATGNYTDTITYSITGAF